MWKAFKEYEDSVARQHANTIKRLTVRLNESEKNRKIVENKLKRCQAKLEKAERELAEKDEQIAEKDRLIADMDKKLAEKEQTIQELKKRIAEAERSRFEDCIFIYILAGLDFKVQKDLIILMLTEKFNLTRFEAGEYYNDFFRRNVKAKYTKGNFASA